MLRVLSMIFLLFLLGCTKQRCRDTVNPIPVQLEVQRIDQEIFQANSAQDIELILNENPSFSKIFLDSDEYPSNAILAEQVFALIQNPSIDTLFQESQAAFSAMDQLVEELENALGRLKVYYPAAPAPRLQTAVTGLYKDLVITNNEIIIGMDFFIGSEASYPPQQIPEYILKRYDTKHLPANVIQFVSSQFIDQSDGESMLSEMIDHGKSYYLLSKLLPCTPGNILIGYTEQEWNDAFENDAIIWASFIENELIYETNHQMKQKFLGERPNVYEIGDKCPGRIGRWLGWQIVEAYAEETGASVQAIMSEKDASQILRMSKYKPSSR